jgi:hypothetical protein
MTVLGRALLFMIARKAAEPPRIRCGGVRFLFFHQVPPFESDLGALSNGMAKPSISCNVFPAIP